MVRLSVLVVVLVQAPPVQLVLVQVPVARRGVERVLLVVPVVQLPLGVVLSLFHVALLLGH